MAKKRRIIDQLYNGAFEKSKLTKSSRNALITSGTIIGAAALLSLLIQRSK